MICCRFIYVRYATGLIKEGVSLLHWITAVISITFMAKRSGFHTWHTSGATYLKSTLKMKFCTMQNITYTQQASMSTIPML